MGTKRPAEVFLDRLRRHTPEGEQKAMAQRAGISEQTLCRWMTGKQPANPTLATLEKLARAYRIPLAELISDEPREPPSLPPEEKAALESWDAVVKIVSRATGGKR